MIDLDYSEIVGDEVISRRLTFSSHLIKRDFRVESLFVSKVDGRSMEPLIDDRALVIADISQRDFSDGDIYLIYKDNAMWIKQAFVADGERFFISINPDYKHLQYRFDDCRVVATVLLSFKNH